MSRAAPPFPASLWRHRELLWQFTLRAIELRHKGSHLGLAWSVFSPLLLLALYVMVFGFILEGTFSSLPNESRVHYALGVFLGLALFHLLAETLAAAPTVIAGTPNFVKKVVFPLEILPVANVGGAVFHLLISLTFALIGVAVWGNGLGWSAWWLPVIVAPLVLLALGLSWLVSAIGVFFRDIAQLTTFLSVGLMFSSAVFYPASRVPPAIWEVLRFNPLLVAIEQSRAVVIWHKQPDLTSVLYLHAAGIALCWLGQWTFRKLSRAFADVI